MTNELDPDVKAMRDAEGDAARAEILLSAPVRTLLRLREVFVGLCRRARFDEGEAYLDALRDSLDERRYRGVSGGVVLARATTTLLGVMEKASADVAGCEP